MTYSPNRIPHCPDHPRGKSGGFKELLQVEQGLLPKDAMERLGYATFDQVLDDPQYACLWPTIQRTVSPSMIAFIEGAALPDQFDCSQYSIPPTLGVR